MNRVRVAGAQREDQQEHRAAGRRLRLLGEADNHEERRHGGVSAHILPLRPSPDRKLCPCLLSLRTSAAKGKTPATKAKKA